MKGKKILVTGGTGQVARPVAEALAEHNEVWCLGRFGTPGVESELAERGIRTFRWDMDDLGPDTLAGLPEDFTHVIHSAVRRGEDGDFNAAVTVNSVSVGRLMTHCRTAEAFLYVSTGAVYARQTLDHLYTETDPIDGKADWLPAYPVGKIAAEGTVRAFGQVLGLPTTIARLNIAYGPGGYGGVPMLYFKRMLLGEPIPVPVEGQNWCSPLHTDDLVRQVPLLWEAAAVPTTLVNWGGDESMGITDCVRYLEELTGVTAELVPSETTRETYACDPTLRRELTGPCQVTWHDGIRRTVESMYPDLVKARSGDTSRTAPAASKRSTPAVPSNRESIEAAYRAFHDRDVDALLATFDPDIAWVHPDSMDSYGLGGTKKGHAGVKEFLAHVPTVLGGMRLEPLEIIESGDRVVVFGIRHFTSRSGRTETHQFVHSWTFQGGKATRMEDIFDTVLLHRLIES